MGIIFGAHHRVECLKKKKNLNLLLGRQLENTTKGASSESLDKVYGEDGRQESVKKEKKSEQSTTYK